LQKEEMDELMKETVPTFLKTYEKFLTDNGTGWLVGKQVRMGDCISGLVSQVIHILVMSVQKYF